MKKSLPPTASLAMVAAATVVTGAFLALAEGSRGTGTVLAVERLETASLRVDEVHLPVTEVLERALAVAAPVEGPVEGPVVTPLAQLIVLDSVTGLGLDEVTVTLGGRVDRLEPIGGQPISLELGTSDQRLEVGAAGYRPRLVTVHEGETEEIRLNRSTTLRGVVRDAFGAPMPHTGVRLIASADAPGNTAGDDLRQPTLRRTDLNGAFTFDALQPGVYRTSVELSGETHLSRPLELREGEWAQADHRLATSAALSVQVETSEGLPVERARLLIQRDGASAPITRYTDDHGNAAIRPLPAGSYELTVQSAEGTSQPRTFTIKEAGQGLVDLHIQLLPAPRGTEN